MGFDPLAPHYRRMERILAGNLLHKCRVAHLDALSPAPKRILLAGEGHGRTLTACRRQFPDAHITWLDASPAMQQAARLELAASGLGEAKIQWMIGDLRGWRHNGEPFDLITTHFVLDCFPPDDLEQVIANLVNATQPGTHWLVADFAIPEHGPKRWRAKVIHTLMYAFFRIATRLPAKRLTDPAPFLKQHGFAMISTTTLNLGLLHATHWQRREGK